jgi:hypothetical protein
MLAKHALSQLSYGPGAASASITQAASSLIAQAAWDRTRSLAGGPAQDCRAHDQDGGPGKT